MINVEHVFAKNICLTKRSTKKFYFVDVFLQGIRLMDGKFNQSTLRVSQPVRRTGSLHLLRWLTSKRLYEDFILSSIKSRWFQRNGSDMVCEKCMHQIIYKRLSLNLFV